MRVRKRYSFDRPADEREGAYTRGGGALIHREGKTRYADTSRPRTSTGSRTASEE